MPNPSTIPLLKESLPLLQGKGQYLDDIQLPNTLHVAFVRSPYAHANILEIGFFLIFVLQKTCNPISQQFLELFIASPFFLCAFFSYSKELLYRKIAFQYWQRSLKITTVRT